MTKLVVFDMAGTTVDEGNLVYKTIHRIINDAGFEVSYDMVLHLAAGKSKLQAIRDVLQASQGSTPSEETVQGIYQNFIDSLNKAYHDLAIKAQPGTEYVFQQLRNHDVKVALNTGYKRNTADLLLDKLGWIESGLVDYSITSDDVDKGRPYPDMIHKAMQYFNIEDASSVAKVGDSIVDIEEGKAAGCAIVVGITSGAHSKEQLKSANPTHILDELKELLPIIGIEQKQ